ncbi:hypothetical protein [Streptomyces sp. CB03911]|uniref:hypothetical protein n=1 Tax=Streptomyces sp. CB03911 TaxID=1804758 RepID=UPI0018FEA4AE|nr:hypothetical protein [Streptomyces sp. CB03911]
MTARLQAWMGGVTGGAAVVGLAVYLGVVGLDDADRWASVLGLFVALAGLGLGVAGRRRERADPVGAVGPTQEESTLTDDPGADAQEARARAVSSEPVGQTVEGSTVTGGITQVSRTRGSVRIVQRGPAAPLAAAALPVVPPPDAPLPPAPGDVPAPAAGQHVRTTTTVGPVNQVHEVDGDVEIEAGP